MNEWKQRLSSTVVDAERRLDRLKYRLQQRLRAGQPYTVLPYLGYGSRNRLFLTGRVLRNHPEILAQDSDSIWRNLLNTYRRLESDEVPDARLAARFDDVITEIVSNEEGFFQVTLTLDEQHPAGSGWNEIRLTLLEPQVEEPAVQATGRVYVPAEKAQFGVISDLDDTVIQTHATRLMRMARTVFLENARTRLPFPGVAAFYRALRTGNSHTPGNPLFYVSSSPWNLYELFLEFFELQGIPIAPTLLRDWGLSEKEWLPFRHAGHKLQQIEQILAFFPRLPFILIGDSGQEDPEIYHQVVHQHPQRILAVYIRDVSHNTGRRQAIERLAGEVETAGSTLITAADTLGMANHAARHGWIEPAALTEVERELALDKEGA